MPRPALTGSHAIGFFEIAHEVAPIAKTDLRHDFFDTQKSCFEQLFSLPHFLHFQKLSRSHPGTILEQMAKARRRDVNRSGQLRDRSVVIGMMADESDDLANSLVHFKPPFFVSGALPKTGCEVTTNQASEPDNEKGRERQTG